MEAPRSILKFTSQHRANVYVVSWIDVNENRHVGRRSHLRPKDTLAEVTFPNPQCSRIYRACAVTCNGLTEYAHCRRSSQLAHLQFLSACARPHTSPARPRWRMWPMRWGRGLMRRILRSRVEWYGRWGRRVTIRPLLP